MDDVRSSAVTRGTAHGSGFKFRKAAFSLRFSSPREELGYVRSMADRNAKCVWKVSACAAVYMCLYMLLMVWNSQPYPAVIRTLRWAGIGSVLTISTGSLLLTSTPDRLEWIGPRMLEGIVVIQALCYFAPFPFLFDSYYQSMLLGVDEGVVIHQSGRNSDSWLLMTSVTCSLIFNHFMAIRWCLIWPFDVICVLCYAVCTYFWSHESPWVFFAFNFCQVVLTLSHRGAELKSREMFVLLTDERVQRVQAEFRMEHHPPIVNYTGGGMVHTLHSVICVIHLGYTPSLFN